MGVPKFYRWISERYPCLSEVVQDHQIPEFDNLYLDMNGIIHVCSHPDDNNPHFRITEEQIFADIFHYLEVLFRMIKPRKVFFMAIDGVAPRAKMNQQRGRRFRSAKDAENLEKQARQRGEVLPTEARFDSNCITPGTEFMVKLHEQLKYFVVNKISNDELWKNVTVYLSGHETPGEGEHKIMDFIRSEKSKADYDPNTRHCLYGLDADLIMLGLTTHEPHFALLREEVRFGKQSQKRNNTVEETTFHLLHISLLREYLDLEFASLKSELKTFSYDLERVIDDWVLMGFLVGNDFIPHLPHLHIAHDALPTIWTTYKQVLPQMGGYLNEKGKINLFRLETFLVALSEYDKDKFNDGYADMKYMESKTGKPANSPAVRMQKKSANEGNNGVMEADIGGLDDFGEEMFGELGLDDENMPKPFIPDREENEDAFSHEFRKYKSYYYFDKMGLQANTEVLADQAKQYVIGLQWILFYYYTGVPSWSWFFPHHYAPFMSDLVNFSDMEIVFDTAQPFLPFQQLMAVLPAASKKLLPPAYQELMISENSPIIEFYPADFDIDLNGKKQDWEAVVLIPFIEEIRLLDAMKSVESRLSGSEKKRNKHGPCLIYRYCKDSQGIYPASCSSFPDIAHNHTVVEKKTWQDFVPSLEDLKAGLCGNVKPTLFYPGFPTFAHIDHKSYLQKMGCTVFQQASRGDNRIVQILDDLDIDDIDVMKLGTELIGESMWVNWPHLFEAKVTAISTDEWKVVMGGKNNSELVKTKLESADERMFLSHIEAITEQAEKKRGVDIGPTFVLVYAKPIAGRKYAYLKDGRVTIDKEWHQSSVVYALQACVRNSKMLQYGMDSGGSVQIFTLADVFPTGTTVFMLAPPYYGSTAQVQDHVNDRVRVKVEKISEPDLQDAHKVNYECRYMKTYEVAQHLGVSSHFVSRITGSMLILRGSTTLNIGLDLKNNKRQEECPGFTKKQDNDWLYSHACQKVLLQYLETYPDLCNYLYDNLNKDKYSAESIFPENTYEETEKLMEFVKSLPTYKCPRAKIGGEFLEEPVVSKIEELVTLANSSAVTVKEHILTVKPSLLFKQFSPSSTMMPDPDADYRLFDRVVNIRQGYTVPYGLKGTVTGIIPGSQQYEIVFDEPFAAGLALRCTKGRGYRCPSHSLINISYGERKTASKTQSGSNTQQQVSYNQSSSYHKQTSMLNSNKTHKQHVTHSPTVPVHRASTTAHSSNQSNNSNSQPQIKLLTKKSQKPEKQVNGTSSSQTDGGATPPTNSRMPRQPQNAVRQASANKSQQPRSASNQKGSQGTRSPASFTSVNSNSAQKEKVTSNSTSRQNSEGKNSSAVVTSSGEARKPDEDLVITLMGPKEFVTPKTEKFDGRKKSSDSSKSDLSNVWAKLQVKDVNSGNVEAANDCDADMSKALAALQPLIQKSPPRQTPPSSAEASSAKKRGSSKKSLVFDNSASAQPQAPKPGQKLDISALLGQSEASSDNQGKADQPEKKEKTPLKEGHFDFNSLVKALEDDIESTSNKQLAEIHKSANQQAAAAASKEAFNNSGNNIHPDQLDPTVAKLLARWKEEEGEETTPPPAFANTSPQCHQRSPNLQQHHQPQPLTPVQQYLIDNFKKLPTHSVPIDQRSFNPNSNYFDGLQKTVVMLGLPEPIYNIATENNPNQAVAFRTSVRIADLTFSGERFPNERLASQNAAMVAITKLTWAYNTLYQQQQQNYQMQHRMMMQQQQQQQFMYMQMMNSMRMMGPQQIMPPQQGPPLVNPQMVMSNSQPQMMNMSSTSFIQQSHAVVKPTVNATTADTKQTPVASTQSTPASGDNFVPLQVKKKQIERERNVSESLADSPAVKSSGSADSSRAGSFERTAPQTETKTPSKQATPIKTENSASKKGKSDATPNKAMSSRKRLAANFGGSS